MRVVRVALLLLALALSRQSLSAQPVTGSVAGSVSASTGIGLPGATVTAINAETAVLRTVTTGDDGEYVIDGLPVGDKYEVRAELDGFAPVSRTDLMLTPGGRDIVSFLLVPATTETLSVIGRTTVLEQQRSTLQETIPEQLAHSVPLVGRDFIALASLTPGFTGSAVAPSPNGQVYWSNNILVDGASHFSKWRSAARTFYSGYSLEAIREVQVLNSQFAPEYGEALASVTSAVTKSGTNERHGSVLLFAQAGVLNDRPIFADRKPPASSARFGFTLGGPITRDHTFYFASYEGRRTRSNNIVVSPAAPQTLVSNNEDEHLGFFKLNHRFSPNNLVSMRYNGQWFKWLNETGGLWLPGSGVTYRNDVHTALLTATELLSKHNLNQARFQFARYVDRRTDLQPSVYVSRAGYSIEGATLGPYGFGATPEDTYEGADTLSHTAARHAVKFGTGFKFVRSHNEALPYGRGAYYFGGPPSLYPQPYAFVQGVASSAGSTAVDPRSVSAYAFVQDEWHATPTVTINYGVRYDVEQIRNVEGYDAGTDRNNFQPRLGATWTPFASRFTVHGGVGIYTQQHLLYYVNRAQLEGPNGSAFITLTPASTLMPTYPGILGPSVLSQIPRDIYVVDPGFRNPYAVQAALGVAHPLFGFDVSADYVYLAGRDLMSIVDANAPASLTKPVSRSVAQADLTRPLVPAPSGYRKIITLGNEGRSWYRALQVKVDRTVGPLLVVSSYTLARARDMANYALPEDANNIAAETARSDNDVRHNITASLTWQAPFRLPVLRAWTLSAIGQFRTNRPYNITWGDDRNGTTQNDARPGARNTGHSDSYRNFDIALSRKFPFGAKTLEARAEAFNILSTTNYDEYVGALSSPLFGQPISAFPKRRLQFAAVVRF